eukprot:CAMPEP_0119034982 /NCGR_PEP_ID=MMETSP1177-20130426/1978_1 /TAXON_ID=2985 /ORGANISM="Ochromonas sp, Strain CCMP1899" /LENGTH=167 /DNA_ID=CAMNT_0006992829 /DNA_START=430 /DNA_END=930 /DNA_ORIENTATION=+
MNRREDLVFLQNGMLASFLQEKGLEKNTQGLIYFAISKKGEQPIDGITDTNPEGLTAVTGKWSADLADRMRASGLSCHELEAKEWEIKMFEKHIWICAFMAIGAKFRCTVGEVEKTHEESVRMLINELARTITKESGVHFPLGIADRLCAYARSVGHFPTALKEQKW